jgi:6,7-dimethyl-8-ribityllumazine synthase
MKSPEFRQPEKTGKVPFAGRFAFVISPYYEKIVMGMLESAKAYLAAHGVTVVDEDDIFTAPGAFEIPLIAQEVARTGKFKGIICLGCVIKGETAHFDYICNGASMGIMNASLATGVPIAFGVLTTYTIEQAEARSLHETHNEGRDAAYACLEAARTLHDIGKLAKAA